jgi:hypothetical protein
MVKMMELENILGKFKPITLEQIDKVSLQDRMDTKYVFNASHLPGILEKIHNQYYILEIGGKRFFSYSTMYYDTEKADMYVDHIRGKLNRYKIRHRIYVDSGDEFLEIKFKNNKNRTIKWRTKVHFNGRETIATNNRFLKRYGPYKADELEPSLRNKFYRMTLVDHEMTHRATLDFGLGFNSEGNVSRELPQIIIAEIKTDKTDKINKMQEIFKSMKIQPSGFSKYCIGRSLAYKAIQPKQSNLKPKLIRINKIANNSIYNF